MKIGFIGTGKLGMPCAEAIAKKGHHVCGYDIMKHESQYVISVDDIKSCVFEREKKVFGLGISKFSDLVGHFSNDLTLQEKLTEKIASFIHKTLDADGVFVKMSAKHLCSDLLNSQNSSEEVITTYSAGVYELDFSLRNEALLNFS